MARKLLRVSMIIDASIIHEVLSIISGKAIGSPEIQAVVHGGESEEGKLQPPPTGREFLLAFIAEHPRFKVKQATYAAVRTGAPITKGAVYTACATLLNEGVLKRIDAGEYIATGKKVLPKVKAPAGGKGKKRVPGQTVPDRIVAFLRGKQNGSGEGVPIADIKKALGSAGISPGLTSLMKRKIVTRPAPGHYRAAGA